MSNLSEEEEIIEIIEELQCDYKEQENEQIYYKYIVNKAKRYSKGLQGLLDLYNKEKEKNQNLLLQLKDSEKELLEVTKNIISKDKIIEKIKELSKTQVYKVGLEEYTIRVLNELLEE